MGKIRGKRRSSKKKIWQLQEAKARFSELVSGVEEGDVQTITKNGRPVAVMISTEAFEKLTRQKVPLLEFFRNAPLSDVEIDMERSKDSDRDVEL